MSFGVFEWVMDNATTMLPHGASNTVEEAGTGVGTGAQERAPTGRLDDGATTASASFLVNQDGTSYVGTFHRQLATEDGVWTTPDGKHIPYTRKSVIYTDASGQRLFVAKQRQNVSGAYSGISSSNMEAFEQQNMFNPAENNFSYSDEGFTSHSEEHANTFHSGVPDGITFLQDANDNPYSGEFIRSMLVDEDGNGDIRYYDRDGHPLHLAGHEPNVRVDAETDIAGIEQSSGISNVVHTRNATGDQTFLENSDGTPYSGAYRRHVEPHADGTYTVTYQTLQKKDLRIRGSDTLATTVNGNVDSYENSKRLRDVQVRHPDHIEEENNDETTDENNDETTDDTSD